MARRRRGLEGCPQDGVNSELTVSINLLAGHEGCPVTLRVAVCIVGLHGESRTGFSHPRSTYPHATWMRTRF